MLASLLLAAAASGALDPAALTAVGREEILQAMRSCEGYDVAATTNSGRFQVEVALFLAEAAQKQGVATPLFVDHETWFQAFLSLRGQTAEEAPVYARLAREYGQDMTIEYRTEKVVARVVKGPPLRRALAVSVGWPDKPGRARSYSFQDLLSRPTLQVTNHQQIQYRLLVFEDRILVDQIEGLTGRPNSGALGLLFRLIGEGRVVEYRMALAADGTQVSRGRARKAFIEVASTLTVLPDGRAEKDVPKDRPDLAALEARLKEPLEIEYQPLDLSRR